jgi:hypothetical protein
MKRERPERTVNDRAPFCKVCQQRHYGVAHVWPPEPKRKKAKKK